MKLIVNLSPLIPPLTGIGHYTKELLKEMLKDSRVEDVQGFLGGKWLQRGEIEKLLKDGLYDLTLPVAIEPSRIKQLTKELIKKIPFARAIRRSYIRIKQSAQISKHRDYIYWEPNYVPLFDFERSFVSIHDLSHLRYPQYHPVERINELELGIQRAKKLGSYILTVSEFSKEEIITILEFEPKKVFAVPNGTAERFFRREDEEICRVKQKYKIDSEYILSVCTVEPRKNLIRVCRAYDSLPEKLKNRYKLILAGKNGWLNSELEGVLEPLEREGFARRIGYVDDLDLPSLYSGAALFAYMSLYEGYGMPIAEALRCAAPVLTSDVEPMRSVGGNAAYLANPLDENDIADKMEMILSGKELPKGEGEPYIYDWSESARMMLDIFEKSLAEKK